jgi:hypothetical protein
MLPLNKVDSPSVVEWWHLQPVESAGVSSDRRKFFLDKDDLIYDRKIKAYPIDKLTTPIQPKSTQPIQSKTTIPQQLTFEEALHIVADKIDTNYEFWYKKKDIDKYFKSFVIKVAQCELHNLNKDRINLTMSFDDAIKIICDKAKLSYDYWKTKADIDNSFMALCIKLGKCLK